MFDSTWTLEPSVGAHIIHSVHRDELSEIRLFSVSLTSQFLMKLNSQQCRFLEKKFLGFLKVFHRFLGFLKVLLVLERIAR